MCLADLFWVSQLAAIVSVVLMAGVPLLLMAALGAGWSRPGVVSAMQGTQIASWALSVFEGVLMARLF